MVQPMLRIRLRDIRRGTLPVRSGNEGWIGVASRGDDYHVVVPVDTQIARGVMACNRPTDGTPFGGYVNRIYFRCAPYEDEGLDGHLLHEEQVCRNAEALIAWLTSYGIEAAVDDEGAAAACGSGDAAREIDTAGTPQRGTADGEAGRIPEKCGCLPLDCTGCGAQWATIGDFLRSPEVRIERYRACPDDFRRGRYLFSHGCGTVIEVPVGRLVRPRKALRSLAGYRACPGFCYYERSLRTCSAICEGASYRRVAGRLSCRGFQSQPHSTSLREVS